MPPASQASEGVCSRRSRARTPALSRHLLPAGTSPQQARASGLAVFEALHPRIYILICKMGPVTGR